MVLLDRALVSSYRLLIVTVPLSEAVWPHFAIQVFTAASTPVWGEWEGGRRGPHFYRRVAVGATLFASLDSFSVRLTV